MSRDLVCYCFDLDVSQIQRDPSLVEFIEKKIRARECACEIRNPSGKCCLPEVRSVACKASGNEAKEPCCARERRGPRHA